MNVDFDLENKKNLNEVPKPSNELKRFLVDYVGNKQDKESDTVTVEMIVETLAQDFPEFLLVVAEENWIRGYQQALDDVDYGMKLAKKEEEIKEGDEK